MTPETMGHVQKVVAERGSDAWWEMGEAELLPEVRGGGIKFEFNE